MMALNDTLLSRAVMASPDTAKQKVRKKPAVAATKAITTNISDHNRLSSSAVRGSANTYT